jgi:hypothetical protein
MTMPSDQDRLRQVFKHIERIKDDSYPAVVGRDDGYQLVERPWADLPERSKLVVLQDAVDWSGISNRDQAHILLSEVDPGKISDTERNRLIDAATRSERSRVPDEAMELFSGVRPQDPMREAEVRETLFGNAVPPRERQPEVSRDRGREI